MVYVYNCIPIFQIMLENEIDQLYSLVFLVFVGDDGRHPQVWNLAGMVSWGIEELHQFWGMS